MSRAPQNTTTTDEFPIRRLARWLYWAAYAQSPAGRRERRILSRPDVREAFERVWREDWDRPEMDVYDDV